MNKIQRSINKGLKFIEQSIGNDLFWKTFNSSQGMSDVWVSSFILNEVGENIESRLGKEVLNRVISSQNPDGGWSYKQRFISDADSTATVINAIGKIKPSLLDTDALNQAVNYLINHLESWEYGFKTYQYHEINKVIQTDEANLKGWTKPHFDVSVNVASALLEIDNNRFNESCKKLISYLLSTNENFIPESYWWCSDYYSCCYLIQLINKNKRTFNELIDKDYCGFLVENQNKNALWNNDYSKNECSFTSSLALRSLLNSEITKEEILRIANSLINIQNNDGSWNSEPILVIPSPEATSKYDIDNWRIDIPGYPNILSDLNRSFISSFVTKTLIIVLNKIR